MKSGFRDINRNILFKNIIMLTILASVSIPSLAQESFNDFYSHSQKINNTGMYVLGSWAIANLATGAYGWSKFSGEKMYFYQMNLFWNVVNASIAGFAIYSNYTSDLSALGQDEMLHKLVRTENILLVNAGLDIGYMGTGLLLKHLSTKSENRADLLKGYGNSLILQGGFLFVFDLALYGILKADRMKFLNNVDLALLPDGLGLGITIPLN